jgi:hypothetical protein
MKGGVLLEAFYFRKYSLGERARLAVEKEKVIPSCGFSGSLLTLC